MLILKQYEPLKIKPMAEKKITYVTNSEIPYEEAFLNDRFILLNMWSEGIWLVDKEFPKWKEIKGVALAIAKQFNDTDTILKLESLVN